MAGSTLRAVVVASASAIAVVAAPTWASAASSATITAVSPVAGPVGSTVDITGTGLSGARDVQFNGVDAGAPSVIDDSHIQAVVPSGATTGPVSVTASDGSVVPNQPTFTVQLPTSAQLTSNAARVTFPGAVAFTATLTSGGQPVSGQPAHLQAAPDGSQAWAAVGAALTTGPDGTVTWKLSPRSTSTYQVVFDPSSSYAGTTSTQTRVAVAPQVVFAPPGVAPTLTRVWLTGSVRPVPTGKVVLDRYYDHAWHAKQAVTVGKRGRFAFPVRFPSTGTYTYRVRRPADSTHLATIGAAQRVTVVKRTLRSGLSGPDVLALQRRLRALHYDLGAVDGHYGFDTVHAVTAFEKVQGLPRDGVVGQAVWKRLANPRIPRLRHPLPGVAAVEIDLTRQVLYYAVNGRIARILDSSTGGGYYYTGSDGTTQRAITPTGHFSVVYKVNHWVTSKLGTLYRPAYFNNDGYAIHGEDLVPPYPASHGCVRITVPAMDRMYSKLTYGMSVWIYRT
jgi:hypothetical protein